MSGTNSDTFIRLNRFLAQLGVGSRRMCDDLIKKGKVSVDGSRVSSPGIKIEPGVNSVSVEGVKLDKPARRLVLLLHKPVGIITTVTDPGERQTVMDFCRNYGKRKRLFPVGRLDINTSGALLITNDGMLCYKLTHPKFKIPKTYLVRVRGGFSELKLERMNRAAGHTKKVRHGKSRDNTGVEVVKRLDKVTVLKIKLIEGRNRQVRNMCEAVGLHVVKLKRTNFGPISVRNLPVGSIRPLTKKEMENLDKTILEGEKKNEH